MKYIVLLDINGEPVFLRDGAAKLRYFTSTQEANQEATLIQRDIKFCGGFVVVAWPGSARPSS